MKKFALIPLILFAIGCSLSSFSQGITANAGFNFSNQVFKSDTQNASDLDWKPGFSVGASIAFPLIKSLSLETGILISNTGYKQFIAHPGPLDIEDVDRHLKLYYLTVPLNLRLAFEIGKPTYFGFIGPNIGIGLYGIMREEHLFRGVPASGDYVINWGTDEEKDHFRRLDMGINAGAGMEIDRIQVGLAYNYGLFNVAADRTNGQTVNNRSITLFLGYKLAKK